MRDRDKPDVLRSALLSAAREFNAGRYFEAHEELEESLDDVPDDAWPLVLGLIQIAVAYHKLTQGLLDGAGHMLEIGLAKLVAISGEEVGIALDPLRVRAGKDLAALRAGCFDAAELARRPPRLVPLPVRRNRPH